MSIVIEEENLPATIIAPPMTDEEFAVFCAERYPDYFVEMTADGDIVIMPPNYPWTSAQNSEILQQLKNWAADAPYRGIATDGTGGFHLPNGARRSPDAAWTRMDRLAKLDRKALRRFWPLSPDFLIELRSAPDRLPVLRHKMDEWMANGTELAWLIDPDRENVEIFRRNEPPQLLTGVSTVAGDGPVEGFVLALAPIWNPLR